MKHDMPPGMQDQYDAATAEQARIFHTVMALLGRQARPDGAARPGSLLERVLVAWVANGDLVGCEHLGSPRPANGLLSRPGRVYCGFCLLHVSRAEVLRDPDHCDVCRRRTLTFREMTIKTGSPITLHGNVCRSCHDGLMASMERESA